MRRLVGPAVTLAGAATGLLWVPVAAADEPAEHTPDMAFIEYLGSWEGEDSEWIVLAGTEAGESERRPSAGGEQDEENRTDEETD